MAKELTMWQVTLDLALDEKMHCLSVDRVQIKHVFLNLMSNAIEAMSSVTDRQRRLAIWSIANDEAVEIAVADSGIGMDASHSERVFDPQKVYRQ